MLNFTEYLIKIRSILKSSEKYYAHKIINDKNCIAMIEEILQDRGAL